VALGHTFPTILSAISVKEYLQNAPANLMHPGTNAQFKGFQIKATGGGLFEPITGDDTGYFLMDLPGNRCCNFFFSSANS